MTSRLPPTVPCALVNVTVAPGSTAPDASVTVPAIAPTPWADTAVADQANTNSDRTAWRSARFAFIPTSPLRRVRRSGTRVIRKLLSERDYTAAEHRDCRKL